MNFDSLNVLECSPQVPLAKYECSPIITVEKYHIFSKRLISDVIVSGKKNFNNLENFHNQSTPVFKTPFDATDVSQLSHTEQATKLETQLNQSDNNRNTECLQTVKYIASPGIGSDNWHNILTSLKNIKKKEVTRIHIKDNKSNLFMKKKINREDVIDTEEKKFKLNEILINGKRIRCLLRLKWMGEKNEEESVTLNSLLYENNFRRLNHNSNTKIKTQTMKKETEKKLASVMYDPKFKKIFKDILLTNYLNESASSSDPCIVYSELLNSFKFSLKRLQEDFFTKKNRRLNKAILSKVEKNLDKVNDLLELMFLSLEKYSSKEKMKLSRQSIVYYYETYDCKICLREFTTGQGLGGHMSRMHPNSSEQYRIKMTIRKSRTKLRQIVYKAKKELLSRYNYDYETLRSNFNSKKIIYKIISEHKAEYRMILKELKEKNY